LTPVKAEQEYRHYRNPVGFSGNGPLGLKRNGATELDCFPLKPYFNHKAPLWPQKPLTSLDAVTEVRKTIRDIAYL
jgi:hypothetical protein